MRNGIRSLCALGLGVSTLILTGCGSGSPTTSERGLRLAVAPLSLPGIGYACYDFRVANAANRTVTSQGNPTVTKAGKDQTAAPSVRAATGPLTADGTTICSSDYGNATGGDITYITPCDADGPDTDGDGRGEQQNTVTIWIDGVYSTGGVDIAEWQDPCGAAGCPLVFTCEENSDTLVEFNFTIMRDANQGFFDVAVNFEDIFCSAKLDTCYGTSPQDQRVIELLTGGDEVRDPTAVFGFACTAGTATDVTTTLLYGPVALVCVQGTFPIDPLAGPGNASVEVGGVTLHYATYRGTEALECDGASCNKAYWNLAIDLVGNDGNGAPVALTACDLAFQTTAHGGTGFANGLPTATNGAYPYIDVDATLTDGVTGAPICQKNPLNGNDPLRAAPSVVTTVYQGQAGGISGLFSAPAMCGSFDGNTAASTDACEPITLACVDSSDCPAEYACDTANLVCVPGMKVFATYYPSNGNHGGTSGADTRCAVAATAAGLSGTFKAWLSDASSSPSTRFSFSTIPYRLVNGTVIASNWADLTDGTLQSSINRTEYNTIPSYWLGLPYVFTATQTDGTYDGAGNTCNNWTHGAIETYSGRVGRADSNSSGWSQSTNGYCNDPWGLYCFEQPAPTP